MKATKISSVCIIAHEAYGAMHGGSTGHVGGVERQTTMLAKWLASRGHKVSILTWNEGQSECEEIDGVCVIKMCRRDAGLPILRFFRPRVTSLFEAMKKANADVYYHNCAEHYAGCIAWWCRLHGRRFVYSTAHDYDCLYKLPLPSLRQFRQKAIFRYGLRRADRRIAQTEYQQALLRDQYGLDSTVLPMPCVGPSDEEFEPPRWPEQTRVVWVGRLDPSKRLEWLLDAAARLPAIRFEIAAAGCNGSSYPAGLANRARILPNITWRGTVSREDMAKVYRGATCLCCTSAHEGFPNTFLEAWSHGIPLVTTFDPDGLVESFRTGLVARDLPGIIDALLSLKDSRELWLEMSRNARLFYQERHSVDAAMPRFERLLVQLSNINYGNSPVHQD